MSELKSTLPLEEAKAINTMTITTRLLKSFDHKRVLVNFDHNGEPVETTVYTLIDEKVAGYLPSKVWWDDKKDDLCLLYYVSQALPDQARPFGNKPVHCFVIDYDHGDVEYDPMWRVFIDQVKTPYGMMIVVMFNDDLYKQIVNKEI